jgi:hypothetical protein
LIVVRKREFEPVLCENSAEAGSREIGVSTPSSGPVLWNLSGLVRYVVFFVMKLKTRTVEIAGITRQPHGAWMTQVARNLTDARDGFLRGVQYLIPDRDPLHTAAFRRVLRDSGVKPLPASTFERVCRTVCRVRQVRVLGANRATWQRAPPGCRTSACASLQRRFILPLRRSPPTPALQPAQL